VTVKAQDGQGDFWFASLGGVTVDGANVAIGAKLALMDTGTTLLVVPANDAQAIHDKIPGAKSSNGHYTVPCNTNASVALQFGGKSFPINSKDLTFASNGRTTGDCTSGIGAFGAGADPNQWLVCKLSLASCFYIFKPVHRSATPSSNPYTYLPTSTTTPSRWRRQYDQEQTTLFPYELLRTLHYEWDFWTNGLCNEYILPSNHVLLAILFFCGLHRDPFRSLQTKTELQSSSRLDHVRTFTAQLPSTRQPTNSASDSR
jgi:hypothetical protein